MRVLLLIVTLIVTTGCTTNYALFRTVSSSARSDVFQELTNGSPIPPGHADLRITASLKTHRPGRDVHGTPDYRLLIDIDGQAVELQGSLQGETSGPKVSGDPEAGDGIRYRFSKDLRLKAGSHRVIAAIPADGVAVEHEVALAEGTVNRLVLEPLYRVKPGKRRLGRYGETSFLEGIRGFRLVLNGQPL